MTSGCHTICVDFQNIFFPPFQYTHSFTHPFLHTRHSLSLLLANLIAFMYREREKNETWNTRSSMSMHSIKTNCACVWVCVLSSVCVCASTNMSHNVGSFVFICVHACVPTLLTLSIIIIGSLMRERVCVCVYVWRYSWWMKREKKREKNSTE